jgi:hypothetical protein
MPYVERVISLRNGPPWGFRLVENPSTGLNISRIRKNSPAEEGGLHEGDRVIAINGIPMQGLSHGRAVQIIDFAAFVLNITVGRHESKVVENFFFETQKPTEAEKESSMLFNLDYCQPQEMEYEPEPEPELEMAEDEEPVIIPASPGVQPISIKKLQQPSSDVPPLSPHDKKKNFADSAFYHDVDHHYPTIEEQKEMAKKVASSLTAQINMLSKGAAMFGKRKNRANKWTTGSDDSDNESEDEHVGEPDEGPSMQETAVPVMYGFDLETTIPDDAPLPIPPPPPLPPPPGFPGLVPERKGFVPPPPPPIPGAPKTEKEFLERIKAYPRTKHNTVTPETCFDIASALHNSNSRGAQIFAKRRQRAQKWELENVPGSEKESQEPQPKLAMTLGPNAGIGRLSTNLIEQPLAVSVASQPGPTKAKIPSKLPRGPEPSQAEGFSSQTTNVASESCRPVAFNINKEKNENNEKPIATKATFPSAITAASTTGATAGWKSVPFSIPQKANVK